MKKNVQKKPSPIKTTIKRKSINFSNNPRTGKTKSSRKTATNESTLFKKKFRENPTVEQFYRIIHKYKLREEAYKVAIEIYLSRS